MSWQGCKNILCIRPDNMGDLIMSIPAIRALRETFGAKITVLTSTMAAEIVKYIPEIDNTIIFNFPWVKSANLNEVTNFSEVAKIIKGHNFDAAVIFTVYSQNPLPAAMLAYLADIPKTLAYCRENPYHLLTHWVPDHEPYEFIKHQVRRDLDLVKSVGAFTHNESLNLTVNEDLWPAVVQKMEACKIQVDKPWLLLHAGVSEKKRAYPVKHWVAAAKKLIADMGCQLLLTGALNEKQLTDELQQQIGQNSFSLAGLFNLDEFISLVKQAPLLLSVNTGTIHIAAAVNTPVVVLYAQTNPQHTPFNVPNIVLPFAVPAHLRSKNAVIAHVSKTLYSKPVALPTAADIVDAVAALIKLPGQSVQQFPGKPHENREILAS